MAEVPRDALTHYFSTYYTHTAPFDLSGHPALSIPCGRIDGLPIGMMLVGRRFEDATVIRAARTFEGLTIGEEERG